MATTRNINDADFISQAIRQGIKKEAERVFDEMKSELIKNFEQRKDEICTGIVLNMMSYVQMETLRENLVVTIRKDKSTPNSKDTV